MNFFFKILAIFFAAVVKLIAFSPDLFFTSPSDGDTLYFDSQVLISWESKGNQKAKLFFSIDKGKKWNLLASDLASGEILWNLPKLNTEKIIFRLTSIDSEKLELIRKIENAHSNEIRCLDISSERNLLLSSSRDSKIKIWSIEDSKQIDSLSSFVSENYFNAFFYNNKILATLDSALLLWDWQNKNIEKIKLNEAIRSCAANSESKLIAAGTLFGRVFLINESLAEIESIVLPDSAIVYSLNFSNNGKLIAASTYSGHIYLIDWAKKQITTTLSGHGDGGNQNLLVWDCAFSPKDDYLVSCGVDKTVRYWDLASSAQTAQFDQHSAHVRAVDYHKRFNIGLSAGLDNCLMQTDARDGSLIGEVTKADGQILTALYSETCDTIFSAGRDNSIYLWKNRINKIDNDEISCFLREYIEPVIDEEIFLISPNPVSDFAEIKFYLKVESDFAINLLDLSGKKVYNKNFVFMGKGMQSIKLNLWEISSGYYILCIQGNDFSKCKPCLIVK